MSLSKTAHVVVIPAWQPDARLTALVASLSEHGFARCVVVDDGSGAAFASVFRSLEIVDGVTVLRHAVNLGKGRALKTAFNHVLSMYDGVDGVVTVDADGQHAPADVVRVVDAFEHGGARFTIGTRRFKGEVPLRSRFGNAVTREAFHFLTGRRVRDTQSGLRVFPRTQLAEILALSGERYDFEMAVLAYLCRQAQPLQIDIATIYEDGNAGSHFDPIRDSARISFVLIRFYASSLIAAGLDMLIFTIAYIALSNVALSFALGRLSAIANFAINRNFVFRSSAGVPNTFVRYACLAVVIAFVSYTAISTLTKDLHWGVVPVKIAVESILSLLSFSAQRTFVFASSEQEQ